SPVLDRPNLGVDREVDAIGKFLNRRVQQLDDQDEHDDANEREALPNLLGHQEGKRDGKDETNQLLAESLLTARGGEQAVPGIDGGAQKSFHGFAECGW